MKGSDHIEDYLNGALDDAQRVAFLAACDADPELAAETEQVRLEMAQARALFDQIEAPPLDDLRKHRLLNAAAAERRTRTHSRRRFLSLAAVAAAVIVAFLWVRRPAVESTPPIAAKATVQGVRMVTATANPKINLYIVDALPKDLWQGGDE